MVLEYFSHRKHKKDGAGTHQDENTVQTPVLNDEEERFLEHITSQGASPPLPGEPVAPGELEKIKGKDAQTALMDGANEIPLPASPSNEPQAKGEPTPTSPRHNVLQERGQKYWSNISSIVRRKSKSAPRDEKTEKIHAENDGKLDTKIEEDTNKTEDEKQEEDDLSQVLDQLNLAAVNNRVFSFSKESQELLDKFKLVLKDLINGVPTAYDDLEKLLTNSEGQIQRLYGGLPPFLQTLIKGLPAKMTATLGPEILAAASEKPGADTAKLKPESEPNSPRSDYKKSKVPTLKKLVSQQGAIAGMLRSILQFLKLRFPLFLTGTNVLMSLAVFLLLFVFWYCHKRGKETRLSREQLSGETSDSELEQSKPEIIPPKEPADPVKSMEEGQVSASVTKEEVKLPSVLDLPDPVSAPPPVDEKGDTKEAI